MHKFSPDRDWISKEPLTIINYGPLNFCLEYRSVKVYEKDINLTAKEFDILALLILNPHRVFTYEMIMEMVWDDSYNVCSRKTITNHISNLRKKLKVTNDMPQYIKSVHGVGYKFDPAS